MAIPGPGWSVLSALGPSCDSKVRGIEVVLPGNPDQPEQGIAAGIGQRRAHPMGAFVSPTGQTGQSFSFQKDKLRVLQREILAPAQ
jgi:hypothetical protein